jgi:enolase
VLARDTEVGGHVLVGGLERGVAGEQRAVELRAQLLDHGLGQGSEALAACRLCQANGYNIHPCGSRGDLDSIGDFAVGLNSGQIRGVDNNQLLRIEEELGDNAVWLGKAAYKGPKNRK